MELVKYPKEIDNAKTQEETNAICKDLSWMKFCIIVPTVEDAERMRLALRYLHDAEIDTDYVWVNQIVHAYLEDGNEPLIINKEAYEKLTNNL
jgi:hypothetical protein